MSPKRSAIIAAPLFALIVGVETSADGELRRSSDARAKAGARSNARCTPKCSKGSSCCAGSCVDPSRDSLHCGACGKSCAAGEACAGGTCLARVVGTGEPLVSLAGNGRLVYRTYANQGQTNAENIVP